MEKLLYESQDIIENTKLIFDSPSGMLCTAVHSGSIDNIDSGGQQISICQWVHVGSPLAPKFGVLEYLSTRVGVIPLPFGRLCVEHNCQF